MDFNTFNISILCNIFLVFILNYINIRCDAGVIPSGNLGLDEKSDSKRESMHTDESSLPCWQREDYTVMGVCERCEYYETNVFQYCKVTGYKLLLKCKESNINTYKSCEASGWPIEKHFWAFEGTMIGLGIVSCSVVYFRRRMLDAETRRKVRLQIENSL